MPSKTVVPNVYKTKPAKVMCKTWWEDVTGPESRKGGIWF